MEGTSSTNLDSPHTTSVAAFIFSFDSNHCRLIFLSQVCIGESDGESPSWYDDATTAKEECEVENNN